jgi:pyruvate dehydrogenase E2 component (dihydrolipoamide acetyltransferase)
MLSGQFRAAIMDVKLPKLGEGADSGVVVNLFVKEGDAVGKDQPLLELENEKAVAAIPSPAAGVVRQLHVKPGDKIGVGQRLLTLDTAGSPAGPDPVPAPAQPAPARAALLAPAAPPAAVPFEDRPEPTEASAAPPAASPSIRRLARDLGIDLAQVRGSQRGGRIVMADLRAYIDRLHKLAAQPAAASARAPAAAEPVDFAKWGPVAIKPLSPLRQTIARRMAESWHSVSRVTQFDEADVTRLLGLRKQYLPDYEKKGTKLTLTAFLLKALAQVLQQHPVFNASLDSAGENLVLKSYYHIGIAVDTEAGLIVPVIRDVDKKTLVELARDLETVAAKARDRKVAAEDLKGGTFTLSNQGGIGGAHFTPIVNIPQVAILGVGRGAVKPVWADNQFVPRTLVPLAIAYDHRVIDGGAAARFCVDLLKGIEQFPEDQVRL